MAYDDRGLIRVPITFEKGILETQEVSRIPPGFVAQLKNWVPEPTGELRVRPGWKRMTTTGIPANGGGLTYSTRNVWGIGYSPYATRSWVVAHKASATSIRFLALPVDSPVFPGVQSWTEIGDATIPDPASNLVGERVAFTYGPGNVWMANEGFATLYRWNGVTFAASTGSPSARAVAYHGNRVFAGGGGATPYRLFYSKLNAAATAGDWEATSYIDIGALDGEPIEDLASFGDDLLITKEHSAYLLSGSGKGSFTLHQLIDGAGAIGKNIVITPYGAILIGDQYVWMYDGGVPRVISSAVENSWSPDTHTVKGSSYFSPPISGAYLNRKCYISDQSTIFSYDLDTQAWTTEAGDEPPGVLASVSGLLLMGGNGTVGSMLNLRSVSSVRDLDYASLAETFTVETPEIWPASAGRSMVFRHLELILRQRTTGATPLVVTPYVDGVAQTPRDVPIPGIGTHRLRIDAPGKDGYSIRYLISQGVPASGGPVFDIESLTALAYPTGIDR